MTHLRTPALVAVLSLAMTTLPAPLAAQQATHTSIEVDAGAWRLTGHGDGISRSASAYTGVRLLSAGDARLQWSASAAYLWKDDARTIVTGTPTGVHTDVYGVTYLPVTAGATYALVEGPTRVRVGLEGGIVMTRQPQLRSDGPATSGTTAVFANESSAVMVPDIGVSRQWGRLGVRADARLLVGGASAGGVPMFGFGLAWDTGPSRR